MKIIGEGGEIAAVGFGAQHLVKKKIQMCALKMTTSLIQGDNISDRSRGPTAVTRLRKARVASERWRDYL